MCVCVFRALLVLLPRNVTFVPHVDASRGCPCYCTLPSSPLTLEFLIVFAQKVLISVVTSNTTCMVDSPNVCKHGYDEETMFISHLFSSVIVL